VKKKGLSKKSVDKSGVVDNTSQSQLSHFLQRTDVLGGKKIVVRLLDDLLVSQDIDSELEKLPVLYMFISTLTIQARERLDMWNNKLKAYEAELDERARDGEIMSRPTEAKIRAWIARDPEYQIMMKKQKKYYSAYKFYESALRAFELKSRMLQTRSANTRQLTNPMYAGQDPMNPRSTYDRISGSGRINETPARRNQNEEDQEEI
jgi:hypothetical protein